MQVTHSENFQSMVLVLSYNCTITHVKQSFYTKGPQNQNKKAIETYVSVMKNTSKCISRQTIHGFTKLPDTILPHSRSLNGLQFIFNDSSMLIVTAIVSIQR
jgi:hypothetical protein